MNNIIEKTEIKIAVNETLNQTRFDPKKIQSVVDELWRLKTSATEVAPRINDYQDFINHVDKMNGDSYADLAKKVLKNHQEVPLIIGGTSGSTGESKLVLERTNTPGSRPSEDDIQLITELRMSGALGPGDVAVNLFMVGMYSILHHGFNRLLEACYCSIIPLGSLNIEQIDKQLTFMQQSGVNVLAGTPGTLIQMANLVKQKAIKLNIQRILFTGERMGPAKAAVLREVFPNVRIIGCYGLSECGFVAVEQPNGKYRIRDDAYFLEKDETGRLLVTCLNPNLPTPVVRYDTGDQISLSQVGAQSFLENIDRSDNSFNFIGNLIKVTEVSSLISQLLNRSEIIIEVELSTDDQGRDELLIKVLASNVSEQMCEPIRELLISKEEFAEALEKDAGTIKVKILSPELASLSLRNKHRQIIDLRG